MTPWSGDPTRLKIYLLALPDKIYLFRGAADSIETTSALALDLVLAVLAT
jgi:hypothetical protein